MKIKQIQPGVVLTEIHGVYLLAADQNARKVCPYVMQINEEGAMIWQQLTQHKTLDEIQNTITKNYHISDLEKINDDLMKFIETLQANHYIVCEEQEYDL